MDDETAKRIKNIDRRVAEINTQIAALEAEKQTVIESSDPDYADYIQRYRSYYNDEPLGIHTYYEALDEFGRISAEFDAIDYHDDSALDELWRTHVDRIVTLERLLAS